MRVDWEMVEDVRDYLVIIVLKTVAVVLPLVGWLGITVFVSSKVGWRLGVKLRERK